MIREYQKHTRSIEELDELFKHDKEMAAIAVSTVFRHEVSVAISNISEIQQVAQARILADSQVASATVMNNAEVKAARLLADAQKANLKSVISSYDDSYTHRLRQEDLENIRSDTEIALTKNAAESGAEIERAGQDAISNLLSIANEAVAKIQTLAKHVHDVVAENAVIAKGKLELEQDEDRTTREVAENAKQAADVILDEAKKASRALKSLVQKSIDDLNDATEKSVRVIKEATDQAIKRLEKMLSTALELLDMKL